MNSINFRAIHTHALPYLPAIVRRILPDGRLQGHEYVARNPNRADRHLGSFKVNLRTAHWADFAKGDITFSTGMGFIPFTVIVFVLGLFMSFGKAAVYKHIPVYYPENVGSVAGIVGLIGGLGGFFLPLAFGVLNDLTNIWTSCFMLLFALVSVALVWMHVSIVMMEKQKHPELRGPKFFPELDVAPTKR